MKKRFSTQVFILLIFILCTDISSLAAQKEDFQSCDKKFLCLDYDSIHQRTLYYIDQQNGEAAFREYKALEACDKCPEHRDEIEGLSNDIIGIFQKKNAALERAGNEIAKERDRQEQLRRQTEKMAKEASIENYIFQAQEYLKNNEIEKSYWLTDFVYHYIDSSHHKVKKMMHKLYHEKFLPNAFFQESYEEEDVLYQQISIDAVDWSPNKQWLAVGSSNNQLAVFDVKGEVKANFSLFEDEVSITDVSFNQANDLLAVSNDAGKIYFFELSDINGWVQTDLVLFNSNTVRTISWSPVNSYLIAYAGDDKLLHLYDYAQRGNEVTFPSIHQDWIRGLAWSPEGDRLLTSDDEGKAVIWSLSQQKGLHIMDGHSDYVRTVDWHPKGHEIITGSDDNTLVFWDTLGNQLNSKTYNGWIYQARYSESGDRIGLIIDQFSLGILEGEQASFYDISLELAVFDWRGEQNTLINIEEEGEGTLILPRVGDDYSAPFTIPIFDTKTSSQDKTVPPIDRGSISNVAWSKDGNFLAYIKESELIVISEDSIKRIEFSERLINDISWHPGVSKQLSNANLLATVDDFGQIRIWDANNLTLLKTLALNNQIISIAWSPDGKLLACSDSQGNMQFFSWDNKSLELVRSTNFHSDIIRSVAWSPNGKYIATASDDLSTVIYEPIRDVLIDRLEGHSDWVRSVTWLSDSRLATAGDDQKTIVWNMSEQEDFLIEKELYHSSGYHMNVAYTGSETRGLLATYTYDGDLILWSVDRDEIELDSIISLEEISDFSWHPSSRELTYGRYVRFPISLDVDKNYQKESAFNPANSAFNPANSTFDLTNSVLDSINKVSSIKYFDDIVASSDRQLIPFFNEELSLEVGQLGHLQWASDENMLACISRPKSTRTNIVTLYDTDTADKLYLIRSEGDINLMKFSPNNSYFADASIQGLINVRDARTGENPIVVAEQGAQIYDMVWSPDSRFLVYLNESDQLGVWDHREKKIIGKVDCPEGGFKLLFHPDQNDYVWFLNKEDVYVLNLNQIDEGFKSIYHATNALNTNMQWADKNTRLLLSQTQGRAVFFAYKQNRLSDAKQLNLKGDLSTRLSPIGGILCNYATLDTIANTYKRGDRQIVNIRDMNTLMSVSRISETRNRAIVDMAISPDDRYLATSGFKLELVGADYLKGAYIIDIWDIEEAKSLFELEVTEVQKITFSPLGNYLVVYKNSGQVFFIPMNIPLMVDYLQEEDKDYFFGQSNNPDEDVNPILDFIELSGLDQGLNLNFDQNLGLISKRERFEVREAWSRYMIEKGWSKTETEASSFFASASRLHHQIVREHAESKRQDSLALADIYYEEALYYLRLEQYQKMDRSLGQIIRYNPDNIKLDFFHVLLDWQKGKYQKSFDRIIEFVSANDFLLISELQEQYLTWQRKEIELNDAYRFFRIISNDRNVERFTKIDVDILESPTMVELLEGFNNKSRKAYLNQYFRSNRNHEDLQSDDRKYQFYLHAVQYLESHYDETNLEEDVLEDYVFYLYQMVDFDRKRQDFTSARILAEKALAAIRLWMENSPEDPEVISSYLYIFGDLSILELITGEDPQLVKGRINTVLEKQIGEETFMLDIRLGHCEYLLGNTPKAYFWYNTFLNDPQIISDAEVGIQAIEIIIEELGMLGIQELEQVKANLENLND